MSTSHSLAPPPPILIYSHKAHPIPTHWMLYLLLPWLLWLWFTLWSRLDLNLSYSRFRLPSAKTTDEGYHTWLAYFAYVHAFTYVYTCVYRCSACTCAHVWRPKTNVENLLQFLSTWIFKIGSLSKPGAHPFNCWAGQKTPGLNYFPRPKPTLQLQTHIMALDFLHGCWGSELGSSCLHGKQITNEVIAAILTYFFQTNKKCPSASLSLSFFPSRAPVH